MSVIAGLLLAAAVVYVVTKFEVGHSDSAQLTSQTTKVVQKYASALQLALQFFDVQKCNVTNADFILLRLFITMFRKYPS